MKDNKLADQMVQADKRIKRKQSIKNVFLFALGVLGYFAYKSAN